MSTSNKINVNEHFKTINNEVITSQQAFWETIQFKHSQIFAVLSSGSKNTCFRGFEDWKWDSDLLRGCSVHSLRFFFALRAIFTCFSRIDSISIEKNDFVKLTVSITVSLHAMNCLQNIASIQWNYWFIAPECQWWKFRQGLREKHLTFRQAPKWRFCLPISSENFANFDFIHF